MKRTSLFALIALALSGATVAANAQSYDNWYVAPRIGAVAPDSDRETKISPLVGIGIGTWVTPNFAADFEYSINNGDNKTASRAAWEARGLNGNKQWESVWLDVAGRYFFGEQGAQWRPYIVGTVGVVRHAGFSFSPSDSPVDVTGAIVGHPTRGWDPAASLGGGVQYNLSDRLAFRGELQYRFDRDNNSIPHHTGFGDAIASLALVVNFGGAPTPPPVAPVAPKPPVASCRDKDSDGDGVNDCDDKCPNSPAGSVVGPDGCPQSVVIDLRGVNFKFDRPNTAEKNIGPTLKEPSAESIAILDQAVDTLKRYPNVKVEVDGHTDGVGTEAYNQKLSERRAKIVYDYLTGHGIDASRLDGPKGFGKDKPIDTNKTAEGRQRNRRTELTVENQ
ncbi:OmpA family protein [Pseudolysobacter antarcticus]|uniref:OmpA family protein n=1 Tax=Pseudolysobacter antarcticus TaxID=2511995 RepID=A0A411HHG1_9GAMM|nr:OmpA family protein [Pseudolysobacter antarcticus]QBB69844.1 OmpA family protein [Pseudolysobacter antarcticus]